MKELEHRLNNISGTYFSFVHGIVRYAQKKPERYNAIIGFLDSNPKVTPSDVIGFIMSQPDFYEDDVRNTNLNVGVM